MAEVVDFYQIYYDEKHKTQLFPFAIPYYNEGLTVFFENTPIVSLVNGSVADKIAVCSWKLREKLRYRIKGRRPLTPEVLHEDFEVLSFTSNVDAHQMLAFANVHHKGFLNTLRLIGEVVGFEVPSEVSDPIYNNAFCAKSSIYKDYVSRYLAPSMQAMSDNMVIKVCCMEDSRYLTHGTLKPHVLKEKIGLDYYPMHPFLLERLFSIYCHNDKIKVEYL